MTSILYEQVIKSKSNDNEALMEIISRFRPLIRKFSRQLKYDYAETDLIIYLIEIVRNIDLDKLNPKNDQIIVSLIYKSLNNRKIDLFRKYVLNNKEEYELDPNLTQDKVYEENETKIIFRNALNSLSYIQRYIIVEKYFKGYSEAKIADRLNISRQAVNRAKNRALIRLRKLLDI